ncbi:MAG: phosphatidate cytidylyltransferase [Archangium sp.]|nr:phosphatidate cytidylyltransferase [Archangium sp.]
MSPGLKNVLQRVGTAAALLPPIVWLLLGGGWPAAILISAATAVATFEFFRLAVGPLSIHTSFPLGVATLLPVLPHAAPASATGLALALIIASSVWAWGSFVLKGDVEQGARQAPSIVQGVVFCALGPFALVALRETPGGQAWLLAVIAATFGNDAAAFFGGKALGRHKLAPTVSPGKSWEGVFSGAVGSIAAATGAHFIWPEVLGWLDVAAIAVIASSLGPMGDLMKSLLKRAHQVKDAGHLLPGHGGMLDRVDALVVNAPAVWVWVSWLR